MICKNCGNEILEGSTFCIHCGAKVEEAVSEAVEETVSEAVEETVSETVVEPYEEATDAAEGATASVDETMEEAKEAYEQAASDLSDMADKAGEEEKTSSGFYESTETYSDYEDDTEEGGGSIGFAVTSLVCGILSILCCPVCCMSWLFSIAAIVLGIIVVTKRYDGKGLAIGGIATGAVAIILSIIMLVVMVLQGLLESFM